MRLDFNVRDRPGHLCPGDNGQNNARSPDYPLSYDPLLLKDTKCWVEYVMNRWNDSLASVINIRTTAK